MENDLSLELVEAGTSKSDKQPSNKPQQDASFITPTKIEFLQPTVNTTPRRSPRVPKPIQLSDYDSPDFRGKCGSGFESPGSCSTAPTTPKTPKSKATSTPRIDAGSDIDVPDSPNLDAVGSNDSFVVPTSIFKVLLASPKKTPSKPGTSSSGSGSTPSKHSPCKVSDSLNKSGPSPYKSHRPKYLPKNIKLYKKKRMERTEFLQKVEKFDAQLMKLPSLLASPKRTINPIATNDGDLLGTQPHLAVVFHPDQFFITYDEHSFDSKFNVSVAELARKPYLTETKDLRILTLFLTVTSKKILFDIVSLLVEENLNRLKYALDWEDLKIILINLGLTKEFYVFDSAAYSEIQPQKSPKIWNFEFLFRIVEHSFVTWTKKRSIRLVKFLSDCLFDPILQKCQHKVTVLLRRVTRYMLQHGGTSVEELMIPLKHSHYSMIANRMIIQFLATDPILKPLATTLAYQSVYEILKHEGDDTVNTFGHIADVLADINHVREKTSVKDVYQLIIICECLVSMSARPFEPETKAFLEKLADFADQMSLSYSYFENLYFTDTVARLRTLCTVDNF